MTTPRKPRISAIAVAASATLMAACGGGGGDPGEPNPPPLVDPLQSDVIVQLRDGKVVDAVAAQYGLTRVTQFGLRPIFQLRVAAGASADAAIAALQGDPRVRFAERNIESQTPEGRRVSVWAIGGDAGVYAAQWAPQALNLAAAHGISTGSGVRVALLDTGLDATHPALVSRLARAPNGAVLGHDFVDDDDDASEAGSRADAGYGHGSHVAGLVALAAPGARLMPARVLDAQGRGNTWVLAEALGWAVDPDGNPTTDDGAHVINLSLGTTQSTALLKTVTELATCEFDDDDDEFEDEGFDGDRERCNLGFAAVVTAAAGNGGSAVEQQFPAAEAVKGLLSVAASTQQRRIAGFSNSGSWVQIAAPGEEIVSTVPGGGYGVWSGTSMAAPLAAGTVALVMARWDSPRSGKPEDATKRLTDRSAALCATSLRQVDAWAAVTDTQASDPLCP